MRPRGIRQIARKHELAGELAQSNFLRAVADLQEATAAHRAAQNGQALFLSDEACKALDRLEAVPYP